MGDTTEKWNIPKHQGLRNNFSTLRKSILSLFMSISGGKDWGVLFEALIPLSIAYRGLFCIFISVAIFGIANIVTAIFVDSAMQSGLTDRDVVVHEELAMKRCYLRSMQEVFEEIDCDETGCITLEEFESQLNDERVIAYFNALKLDVSDACTLFHLLDADCSNEVGIDEFIEGCFKLQGESRSLDM